MSPPVLTRTSARARRYRQARAGTYLILFVK